MTKKNDGGPAFPVTGEHGANPPGHFGMTLRDYFAAKVAAALAASESFNGLPEDKIARFAYRQADAMLEVRNAS